MQPRISLLNDKKLIGHRMKMSYAHFKVEELWKHFMPQRKEIKNAVNSDLLSLAVYKPDHFTNFDPSKEFEKWAAVEVSTYKDKPPNLDAFDLSGGLYAVFYYKGLNTDKKIYNYIFNTWLPNSQYSLDTRPHFEVLGVKYKNNDPKSEEEIWIPIAKKDR